MCRFALVHSPASILISVATRKEVELWLSQRAEVKQLSPHVVQFEVQNKQVYVVFTGVGMMHSAMHTALCIQQHKPDCVLHTGIAGCFDPNIPLGTLVRVLGDGCPDMGAVTPTGFMGMHELGLVDSLLLPYGVHGLPADASWPRWACVSALPSGPGITVTASSGSREQIAETVHRTSFLYSERPLVETMEGAGCQLAAQWFNLPYLHVRAISNYVEPRNRKNWNIALALESLSSFLHLALADWTAES